MIYFNKNMLTRLTFFCLVFAFCACKDTQKITRLEVLEIFQVEGDDSSKKPTLLKYKDVKQFDKDGLLIQQNFYEIDNSLKGYEFIKREGQKGVTNYYNSDSVLLAIYELEYVGNKISKRTGFDGATRELLRTEIYSYNKNGRVESKSIFDQNGNISNSYKMEYDANGNEILFRMLDAKSEIRMEEKFVVSKTNKDKLWTERWGYINGTPNSFHRRSFSY